MYGQYVFLLWNGSGVTVKGEMVRENQHNKMPLQQWTSHTDQFLERQHIKGKVLDIYFFKITMSSCICWEVFVQLIHLSVKTNVPKASITQQTIFTNHYVKEQKKTNKRKNKQLKHIEQDYYLWVYTNLVKVQKHVVYTTSSRKWLSPGREGGMG